MMMIIIMKIENEKKIHSLCSKSKEYASKLMHIFQAHAPNPANHLDLFKNIGRFQTLASNVHV